MFTRIAAFIFGIVALGHLYRVIAGLEFVVGDWAVPVWVSVMAVIISGVLSVMLWRESLKR